MCANIVVMRDPILNMTLEQNYIIVANVVVQEATNKTEQQAFVILVMKKVNKEILPVHQLENLKHRKLEFMEPSVRSLDH